MTNKFVQNGDAQTITAAGAATQGDIYVGTDYAGVYKETCVTGDSVAIAWCGVFTVTKTAGSGEGWTNGQKIYATATGAGTATAGSNAVLGQAWGTAATGDTTANVKINGG